jgi:hypothetical protein
VAERGGANRASYDDRQGKPFADVSNDARAGRPHVEQHENEARLAPTCRTTRGRGKPSAHVSNNARTGQAHHRRVERHEAWASPSLVCRTTRGRGKPIADESNDTKATPPCRTTRRVRVPNAATSNNAHAKNVQRRRVERNEHNKWVREQSHGSALVFYFPTALCT